MTCSALWHSAVELSVSKSAVKLKCFPHCSPLTCCLFCLQWLRKGLGKLFCSMEKEDLKIVNKGEEEEMVFIFFISHIRILKKRFLPNVLCSFFLFFFLLRSCRVTVCVVGGWPWWASGCCVQGASFSWCSTGCQNGASSPPALVPQPVMPKWCCCAPR